MQMLGVPPDLRQITCNVHFQVACWSELVKYYYYQITANKLIQFIISNTT